MATSTAARRPSAARDRLLHTASGIFYAKGVHAVGIDEILSQAQVTRATFYRHFPSKDDLIVEYLRTADEQIRGAVAAATADVDDSDGGVRAIAQFVVEQIQTPGFRGCAFLNAAAEYPDGRNPINVALRRHRAWFFDVVAEQFERVTRRHEQAAELFVMMRDGAMAEGCLADPNQVTQTFRRGVDGLLAAYKA